jgi:predicted enzyme related to lactoylglutathione lyase
MAKIGKHAPGAFCYVELSTSDQNGAKSFYTSLFGWSVVEFPLGPGDMYTMFRVDGADAAAAYTMRPEEKSQGVPPHWNLYVATANADDTAKQAASLGGKVLAPPFDVMDQGRMAVVQDPTGAAFCIWQANKGIGIQVGGVSGTFCWADLSTADPGRAKTFYAGLFGWRLFASEKDPSGYLHIQNGEDMIGGIPPAAHRNPHIPPHWLVYFLVDDVDASTAKAKEMGAAVHLAPMSMEGVGRMAVLADPQGASFSIFKPSPRG